MSLGKVYLKRLDKLTLNLAPRSAEDKRQSIRMAAMHTLAPEDCIAIAKVARRFVLTRDFSDTPETQAIMTRWSNAIIRITASGQVRI